jgi:hypothetical protein
MKLSKAERDLPEWQAAGEALIMAAASSFDQFDAVARWLKSRFNSAC